jgi:predicted nucleic acid-binding protein
MQMPPPRRVVFIDTQGWAEIVHGLALHHIQAADFLRQAQTNAWDLVTSNLILSELVPLLHSRNFRLPQVQILTLVAHIRAIPTLTVAYIDPALDQQAWGLLAANQQYPWSHVDATSMVLMRQLGITDVLTADQHFTQAGFTILL